MSQQQGSLDRYFEEDRGFDSPCWIWTGQKNGKGYGQVGRRREDGTWGRRAAHRATYESVFGLIPEGAQLDHLCRVRECVNPSHLEPVTNLENCHRGNRTKLTLAQAAEIKRRAEFESPRDLADEFGVSRNTVNNIRAGRTWSESLAAPTTEDGGKGNG